MEGGVRLVRTDAAARIGGGGIIWFASVEDDFVGGCFQYDGYRRRLPMAFAISDYIPVELLEEIKAHLRSRGNGAHIDYPSNRADEDSVTGAFSSSLRQPTTHRVIDGQDWRWNVSAKKFTGKGPRAQERMIGADAIVEFTLEDPLGNSIAKSLLFQAKKDGSQQQLRKQVTRMERVARGCSAIVDYSEDGYRALDGAEYLKGTTLQKRPSARQHGIRLGDYLADEFIACQVGTPGMSYDAVRRELRIPLDHIGSLSVPARIGDRIRITTVGPVKIPRLSDRVAPSS